MLLLHIQKYMKLHLGVESSAVCSGGG